MPASLEYREGAMHRHPYVRVLRWQLEAEIAEEPGDHHVLARNGRVARKHARVLASIGRTDRCLGLERLLGPSP
jgi:hypothetical protein